VQKKRKAGVITINITGEGGVESQKPLSDRELKRQEKRVRLGAQKNISPSTNPSTKYTGGQMDDVPTTNAAVQIED
jgi:hypothetical protein